MSLLIGAIVASLVLGAVHLWAYHKPTTALGNVTLWYVTFAFVVGIVQFGVMLFGGVF